MKPDLIEYIRNMSVKALCLIKGVEEEDVFVDLSYSDYSFYATVSCYKQNEDDKLIPIIRVLQQKETNTSSKKISDFLFIEIWDESSQMWLYASTINVNFLDDIIPMLISTFLIRDIEDIKIGTYTDYINNQDNLSKKDKAKAKDA